MNEHEISFKGKVKKCIYSSDNFKCYAMDVDVKKYPKVKLNNYGNVSLVGDLPDLVEDIEYEIVATEKMGKYGLSYQIVNLKRDLPTTAEETYTFLTSILNENKAKVLYENYPNILDVIKENRLDEIDLRKLKGIKGYTFQKIKEKIIDNFYLMDFITKFQGYFSLSLVRKLYKLYNSTDRIMEGLKEDPYMTLTEASGVGFKTADKLLLEMEDISKRNIEDGKTPIIEFGFDIKTSKQRCLACVLFLLNKNEESGSTKANLIELRNECAKLVPECINHFPNVIKHEKIYLNKDKLEIALQRAYITEKYICDNIRERLENKTRTWSFNTELYRNINGVRLSDEQVELLRSVCENNFTILTAAAGCGKSFSTKALIDMLKNNGKTYILCSPTGKAAQKLSQYTGEQASTIHKTLMNNDKHFMSDESSKLKADVLLVDEFGMTDIYLFKSLLEETDIDTKIVLIGDVFQLNSVGCGALLRDLCMNDKIPHVVFNTIYRMGVGGVLTACTYVRQRRKFLSKNAFTQIGEDKSYSFIPSNKEDMNNHLLELYKKLLLTNNVEDITVISSYNVGENGCDKLNQMLQPIANPLSLTSDKFVKLTQDKLEFKYYIGDMIIQTRNNYLAKLFLETEDTDEMVFIPNGSQGKIVNIVDNGVVIKFEDALVRYDIDDMRKIKHSFAISAHRMQGSQNKIIIFCCPSSHVYFLSNNIMYTAISRAEQKVYHFSDVKTINIAMNKSDSDKRATFLGDMLREAVG